MAPTRKIKVSDINLKTNDDGDFLVIPAPQKSVLTMYLLKYRQSSKLGRCGSVLECTFSVF